MTSERGRGKCGGCKNFEKSPLDPGGWGYCVITWRRVREVDPCDWEGGRA